MSVTGGASSAVRTRAEARKGDMGEFGEPVEFPVDFEQAGHDEVDAALDRLLELPGRELSGHAEVYDDIHQRLRGVLAEQPAGADGAR